MPNIFTEKVIVAPSYTEPDLIITTAQPSGYMDVLAGKGFRTRLDSTTKYIYMNVLDLRAQVFAQQAAALALPSATLIASYIQTPAYRVRVRADYSEIDIAEAGNWNVALPAAQRLAMRQSHFQYARTAALFGVNAGNSEGLLNTPGAVTSNLPPDSYGNTTVQTYDNGEMALFLLLQIQQMLTAMYRFGTPTRIVILGPQQDIAQFELTNVVQLTTYQRPGAGTATTAQIVTKVAEEFGISVEWAFDDTLINAGGANTDLLIMAVPEAIVPAHEGINTNEFQTLGPNLQAQTMQYSDVAAPVEIVTPIADGIDVVSEMRISSGWSPRPEAIRILSMPFTS